MFILNIRLIFLKIIILIYIHSYLLNKTLNDDKIIKKINFSTFTLNESDFTKSELLLIPKYHKYIEICKKLLLIKEIPNYEIIPKISIILPVYNQEKFLPRVIRNIQNQSFKYYEILFVNDASTDRSEEIIKKYKKEDNRIKIINNKKNLGCAYSRANGIKFSKGKYIMFIDPDDFLFNSKILEKTYNRAFADDIDMVQFHLIQYINGNYTIFNMTHEVSKKIIKQPEIRKYWYIKSNRKVMIADYLIYCKLVKREKFIELISIMNDTLIKKPGWNYRDDTAFSIVLFNIVNSYFYTKNLGYYREIHNESLTQNKDSNAYCYLKGYILLIETISKFIDLNNRSEQVLLLTEFKKCYKKNSNIFIKYNNITNDYFELGYSILNNTNVRFIYKKKFKKTMKVLAQKLEYRKL